MAGRRHTPRILQIGAGYFGQLQLAEWATMPEVALVSVIEPDDERRQELRAIYPSVHFASSLDDLNSDGAFDVIDIATPPATHLQIIGAVIKSGRLSDDGVLICQKPFCVDLEEALKAEALVKDASVDLVIHENFRFQPWYRKIAEIIQSERLGNILEAQFDLRAGDGLGPDAYLDRQPYFREMPRFLVRETGIHFVDVFRFLFGEPQALSADLRRINPVIAGEDAGRFEFAYANGLRARFVGNRVLDFAARNPRLTMGTMRIEGEAGELTLDGDGQIHVRERGGSHWQRIEYPFHDRSFGGECIRHFQMHVIKTLTEPGKRETRVSQYIRNIEIQEAIYRSAEDGRRIDLDMEERA